MTSARPGNPAGGPNRLQLTVAESGHDLDLGWTGFYHNFTLPAGGTIEVCLSECDDATDTECTAQAPVGPDPFGAPIPLLASNIPT